MKYCRYMFLVLLIMLLASCASRKVIQTDKPRKPEKTPPVAAVSPADKPFNSARQDELGELRALLAVGDYQKVIESGQVYVKKSRPADAMRQAFEILADAYSRVPLPWKQLTPIPALWKNHPDPIRPASSGSLKRLSHK